MVIGNHVMAAKSDELVGQATLEIFSGRPNPMWTLTEAQTRELRNRITGLSARLTEAPELPDLGYRGVHVAISGQQQNLELTVGRGGIVLQESGTTTNFQDAGRQLERWLLHTAQGKVSPDVLRLADASSQ
jgi:hypothetical protein